MPTAFAWAWWKFSLLGMATQSRGHGAQAVHQFTADDCSFASTAFSSDVARFDAYSACSALTRGLQFINRWVLVMEGEAPAEPENQARQEPRPPKIGRHRSIAGYCTGGLLHVFPLRQNLRCRTGLSEFRFAVAG